MTAAGPLDGVKDLWELLKDGQCVAWVGAGLSAIADYPQWDETVERLCAACQVSPLGLNERSAEFLMEKAEECKTTNPNAYQDTLAALFGRPPVQTRHAYNLLMTLPFKGYVTTNFDPLLAIAAATHGYNDLYSYPSLPGRELERSLKPIFYIHGLARQNNVPRGDNLVLARSDFEIAYNGSVRIFLDSLLLSYPILFLGCSLTEPAVHEALRRVHRVHDQIAKIYSRMIPPIRYAVLPIRERTDKTDNLEQKKERDAEAEQAENERFQELAVSVLRYQVSDIRQHYEIEQVLETLCTFDNKPVTLEPKVGYGEELPS